MKNQFLLNLFLVLCQLSYAASAPSQDILHPVGDIVMLQNGQKFLGEILELKDCTIHFQSEGKAYEIPAQDVANLRFADTTRVAAKTYAQWQTDNNSSCFKGQQDADLYWHQGHVLYMMLGFGLGPIAFLIPLLFPPKPRKSIETMNQSPNQELFSDPAYLKCYRKKARRKLNYAISLGWLVAMGIAAIISVAA